MDKIRRVTETVQRVGREALRLLRAEEHVTLRRIAHRTKTSDETAKRAIAWLRREGAPIEYVAGPRAWHLADPTFALPLTEPSLEDLEAALMAAGLLRELGQNTAATRARALFDELAHRITDEKIRNFRPEALRVTQSAAQATDPKWLLLLLGAARRGVVRVSYRSPWSNESVQHTFEPWQVWLHDGTLYVRGYSRTRREARTFRLANIRSVGLLGAERPRAPVPATVWGEDDPRFGVDEDRPGEAVVRFTGGVARWVSMMRWHPTQHDVWLVPGEVLERCVRYRSCRELARRLASFGDAIASIAPGELCAEVHRIASAATQVAVAGRCEDASPAAPLTPTQVAATDQAGNTR